MAAVSESFYEVLGVSESATAEEIKRGYRKMAVLWHPDKNPAPDATERFKLIAEAYSTLSDDAKRAEYDAYGRDGGRAPSGNEPGWSHHHDGHASREFADSLFRMFFGGQDPFAHVFGDMLGGGFGAFGGMRRAGGFGMMGSLFDDPVFQGMPRGGGMHGSMMSFSSSSFSGGGGGGTSTSVTSQTTIENGVRVTRTTRTVRHPDGRVETNSDVQTQPLSIGDGAGRQRVAAAPTTAFEHGAARGYDRVGAGQSMWGSSSLLDARAAEWAPPPRRTIPVADGAPTTSARLPPPSYLHTAHERMPSFTREAEASGPRTAVPSSSARLHTPASAYTATGGTHRVPSSASSVASSASSTPRSVRMPDASRYATSGPSSVSRASTVRVTSSKGY